MEGAEADPVASFSDDIEEGGGDIVIAVEPAEEGRRNKLAIVVNSLDDVTGFELIDGNLVTIEEGYLGQ